MHQNILVIIITHRNGITAIYGQGIYFRKISIFVFQHDVKYIFAVMQFSVATRRYLSGDPVLTENIRIQIPTAGGNGYFIQEGDAISHMVDKHKNIRSVYRRALNLRDFRDSGVYRNHTSRRFAVARCGGNRSRAAADRRYFSVYNRCYGLSRTRPCDRFIRRIARQNGCRKRFAFADLQRQGRFIERHGSYFYNFERRLIDGNCTSRLFTVMRLCGYRRCAFGLSRNFSAADRRDGRIRARPSYALIRRIARQNGCRKRFAFADLQRQGRFIERHGSYFYNFERRLIDGNCTSRLFTVVCCGCDCCRTFGFCGHFSAIDSSNRRF